jgi:hypothetical protein
MDIRRRSRSSPHSSPESAARKPEGCRPSGLPWAWRSFSRLAFGMLAIIVGLLMFGPAASWLGGTYFITEATYVRQTTLKPFLGPHLRVEVRFTAGNGPDIIANVYPFHGRLPNKSKLVPIIYSASTPRSVYYNGPGGDYYAPTVPIPLYPTAGTILVLAGLYSIVSVLFWRRRISFLISQRPHSQHVDVRWQHEKRQRPTVIVTDRENGAEYAWEVVPAETPVDGFVRRTRPAAPSPAVVELLGEPGPHKWLILQTANDIVYPASLAEPVVGTDPVLILPASYRNVSVVHRRLIATYVAALERAGALPLFLRPPVPYGVMPVWHPLRTLLCWRSLVRLHVESHIRRQLRHLSQAYVRSQLLILEVSKVADEQRRGFDELRGECQLLSSSLTDIRRRLPSVLVGLVTAVPALAAIVQIHQVRASRLAEAALAWIFIALLVMPGLFALTAYTDAFRCKRELFASTPAIGKRLGHARENIYEIEDELFAQLRQRKLPERAADCWAYALVLVTWTAFGTWGLISAGPYSITPGDWILFMIFTLFPIFVLIKTLIRRHRSEDR